MNLEPGAGGGNWGKTALGGPQYAVCEIGFSDSRANAKDCGTDSFRTAVRADEFIEKLTTME
jgi:hypothetical protein